MGTTDRTIRILAAIAIFGLYFFNQISGIAAIILLVIAGILFLTGYTSFCPIYSFFGLSTKKNSLLPK
ncbi:MAG: YgaP family membrane protein [Candidatus Kapaibacteriota bacterium]